MPKMRVRQRRSGAGHVLTDIDGPGPVMLPDALPEALPELFEGPEGPAGPAGPAAASAPILLVGSSSLEDDAPADGRRLAEGLWAFEGPAVVEELRRLPARARGGALFALVPALPDEGARRRWIPDPLRPWDAERLGARVYGQLGKRYQQRGLWLASDADRMRWIRAAFARVLAGLGLERLPNGDVTVVFELPTDSTFDASFAVSGRGDSVRIRRRLESRGLVRTWTVRRGEWEAEERTSGPGRTTRAGRGAAQWIAGAGIVLLSVPVFVLVAAAAVAARLTGSSTEASRTPR